MSNFNNAMGLGLLIFWKNKHLVLKFIRDLAFVHTKMLPNFENKW